MKGGEEIYLFDYPNDNEGGRRDLSLRPMSEAFREIKKRHQVKEAIYF